LAAGTIFVPTSEQASYPVWNQASMSPFVIGMAGVKR
jgi:hypothetical protein